MRTSSVLTRGGVRDAVACGTIAKEWAAVLLDRIAKEEARGTVPAIVHPRQMSRAIESAIEDCMLNESLSDPDWCRYLLNVEGDPAFLAQLRELAQLPRGMVSVRDFREACRSARRSAEDTRKGFQRRKCCRKRMTWKPIIKGNDCTTDRWVQVESTSRGGKAYNPERKNPDKGMRWEKISWSSLSTRKTYRNWVQTPIGTSSAESRHRKSPKSRPAKSLRDALLARGWGCVAGKVDGYILGRMHATDEAYAAYRAHRFNRCASLLIRSYREWRLTMRIREESEKAAKPAYRIFDAAPVTEITHADTAAELQQRTEYQLERLDILLSE